MPIYPTDPSTWYFTLTEHSLEGLDRYKQLLRAYLGDLETAGPPAVNNDGSAADIIRGWIYDRVVRSTLVDNLRGSFIVTLWSVYTLIPARS
jgi:hypothetical protein